MKPLNVYEARHKGRDFCNNTEGSDHYKEGGIEPLDLAIAKGTAEDFCITNISKYAFRFKNTRNLKDLQKASDYAQILCGIELDKQEKKKAEANTAISTYHTTNTAQQASNMTALHQEYDDSIRTYMKKLETKQEEKEAASRNIPLEAYKHIKELEQQARIFKEEELYG